MQEEPDSQQPPAEGRRCASCGTALDESARYCPSCGQPAAQAPPDVDVGGWAKAAWNLFVNNIPLAVAIPLVVIVPAAASGFFVAFAYYGFIGLCILSEGDSAAAKVGLIVLGSFIGLTVLILALVMPALRGGVYACFLEGIRTGKLRAGPLKAGFRNWWACTWVVWLLQVATFACIPFVVILVGIPAMVAVSTLMWLALFHIVDKGEGGLEALSFAWGALRGRFWMMLVVTVLAFAFMQAGAWGMYVGILITTPIGYAGLAAGYDALRRKQEPTALS